MATTETAAKPGLPEFSDATSKIRLNLMIVACITECFQPSSEEVPTSRDFLLEPHPQETAEIRWSVAPTGPRLARSPCEVGVEQGRSFFLVAGHQMAVSVECDRE